MKTFIGGGRQYNLYWVTGKVLQVGKNMETRVTGSGGGGFSYKGTGATSSVSISSQTIVHDQLILEDGEGVEHSFQLMHFDIAARESNVLTVLWAIKQGKESGKVMVVRNKTTRKTYFRNDVINGVFFHPWWYPVLAGIGIGLIAHFIPPLLYITSIAWIAIWIIWYRKGRAAVKHFKTQTDFDNFS